MNQHQAANLVCDAMLERKRQTKALLAERHEWAEAWALGWSRQWDDRAMRIIEAERRRIEKALAGLEAQS